MKLKTLAIAVAMAAVPFAAQADLKISGDVGVGYFSSSEKIQQFGTEVNVDASEKIGGLTYYGHVELEPSAYDEMRVGVKGGFGEVAIGDMDNGCNQVDIGGSNEINLTHKQGGCQGDGSAIIMYKRALGNFSGAVSYNPDAEQAAFGIKGAIGPVGVSLGFENNISSGGSALTCTGNAEVTDIGGAKYCVSPATQTFVPTVAGGNTGTVSSSQAAVANNTVAVAPTLENNIVLGLTGKIGPFGVGFRGHKTGDEKAVHGINAIYSRGANSFYGGLGTSSGNDSKSLGFKHTRGQTDFVIEASDSGVSGADTDIGLGMRHRF